VNRADFQQLADVRIAEAQLLLDHGMCDGAYYLAGYAVECALKACIAKLTRQDDFPPKNANNFYTHNIESLVNSADLAVGRKTAAAADTDLLDNWRIVLKWNEESRYERKTETEARDLSNAITDPAHGVLPWIKVRW
jgi:HEPN domain-containing protein